MKYLLFACLLFVLSCDKQTSPTVYPFMGSVWVSTADTSLKLQFSLSSMTVTHPALSPNPSVVPFTQTAADTIYVPDFSSKIALRVKGDTLVYTFVRTGVVSTYFR